MNNPASTESMMERLKAEGNALFGDGDYRAAYEKYSEAIRETSHSSREVAILYANRAACCLSMKEYMDAVHDGKKATNIDPTYVKAWVRVATAFAKLESWDQSRAAWESALSSLPTTDLSPAQVTLKTQFETELKTVNAAETKSKASVKGGKYTKVMAGTENMPWSRALALAQDEKLVKGPVPSSGWVILNAYRDFIRGMTNMQQMVVKSKKNKESVQSSLSVLSDITNGILRDERVFHANGQFFDLLQKQTRYEAELTGAWVSGGPKQVQDEVPKRLRATGWLPVRRALSVTVRIWIMRGFLDSNMGALNGGVEFYKRALDVLEWGRLMYPNVPIEVSAPLDVRHFDCAIFEASFVRGVRRAFMNSVLYMKEADACGYTLDDITQIARNLKAETEMSEGSPYCALDTGFYASFWIYPIADALSVLGWYHMQLGLRSVDATNSLESASRDDFFEAAKYYIQSAEKYPEDDEKHPHMLAVALEGLWWGGAPLRETLPVCRNIRATMPKVMKIWQNSSMFMNLRNANCFEAIAFLKEAEEKLAEGVYSLDNAYMPADMAAYEKYSEAIKEDSKNAVLYANRAATSLSMKEFLDAANDAKEATKLDPSYAKAWARLASASQGLGVWDQCFSAWDTALACIPSQDLTDAQKALQAQLQEGLKASKAAQSKPVPRDRIVEIPTAGSGGRNAMNKMPWTRAAAMEKKIIAEDLDSSAIIILYASRTFERGVKTMKTTVKKYIQGELAVEGTPNAIEFMSSGILIDRRCFYMDGREWMNQYMEQVKFEGEYYQAWGKGGSKTVCDQAPGRLKKEGWSSVGPAICMTVRLWIMQGFLMGSTGNQGLATEHYRNAVAVIDWGREKWKDVDRSLRGDIFDVTFRRSVNRLFISAVMDWVDTNDPDCSYTPQDVAKLAQDLIKELWHNTPEKINEDQYHPRHAGFYEASWTYPHADALGILGWFHRRQAKTVKTAEDREIHLTAAARNYMEASNTFPADDEFNVLFKSIALDILREQGTPLRQTLPICKQIRKAIPAVLKIWECSAMSKRRDTGIQEVIEWEYKCQQGLLAGTLTPASKVGHHRS
ncbi:TPR-region domain-containing protein [Favolaschia claudopus]|uniref:TPR-region domain-containing protein n=1 Tax=Favolaschia claudopus TaxID=2862362 RepID=A0AAW0EIF5_9AGAR